MISAQMALISGFTPSRTSEYIRIGSVAEPGPVVKLAITRSSSDSVNASKKPAAIDGRIKGSVTERNARKGSQPRSIAASSRLRSSAPKRDCTTTATKHMVSVVWAMVTVQKPRSALSATNNNSSESPVMTSGITSGAYSMPENSVRPLKFAPRDSATAASVPSNVANVADATATWKLIQAASSMARSLNSSVYQRSDQPPHTVTSREALNE